MEAHTLKEISTILNEYVNELQSYDSPDEATYLHAAGKARQEMVVCFDLLRDLHPELIQVNMPNFISEEDAEKMKERIRSNAANRYSLDIIPSGQCAVDKIMDDEICTPTYLPWMEEKNPLKNIVIEYSESKKAQAKDIASSIILSIMLGLPAKKVLLNIFDFNMTGMADMFTVNLDPQLYHDEIIMDSSAASLRLKALLEHMSLVMKKYGNLVAYNNRNKEIAMPYEIVVLCGYPRGYDMLIDQLIPLFENGARCGIYFVVLSNNEYELRNKEQRHLLDIENYHRIPILYTEDDRGALIRFTPLIKNPLLLDVCFDYLREETNRRVKRAVLKQDFNALQVGGYEPVMSEISVTVGLDIESKEEITIRFNSGDYIHAFILGQSGSGKSVLLNNIITTAINKYAPEDLMLYLMDFKGVEFNRYRGVKHTKAVLVDNSDPLMTLEVLRELKEENRKRVKLWQQEGVNNIDGYNKKHPEARIPQVLFVADECQVMFSRVDAGRNSHVIQREIAEIINIIATQGRSQGIHMLFATQQLDETDISGQVLKNLTECFLLMSAPSDSDKLVPDSSNLTAMQPTGQCCYYHKKELQAQVQTFYATDEELEAAIAASQHKAQGHCSNGEAYFKGSSVFMFNEEECNTFKEKVTRFPMASIGRNIGLNGNLTLIPLLRDFSENILFFGANREEQANGVTLNAMLSLMEAYKKLDMWVNFYVIDCSNNLEGKYRTVLDQLKMEGCLHIMDHTNSASLLKKLADDIYNKVASPTILTILGNERFAEIKRKAALENAAPNSFDVMGDISLDMSCMTDLNGDSLEPAGGANLKTYSQALQYILDEGPMQGVHVLLQVDKPANILFEGEYGKNATDKFRHKVILRSENKYLTVLNFSVDIDVETLSDEEEHLRAYYYPEDGEPQLFTPYLMPEL